MTGTRPGGVTLVAVIAWISGAVNVLAGILMLIAALMAPDALLYGLIHLLVGIITIAVGIALRRGGSTARALVTIAFVLTLVWAVLVVLFQQAQIWAGMVSGVLALIGLVLLWTPRASGFFQR